MARDLTRSPFPGMDPYLERYWGDVHHRLCTYACDLLRTTLPPGLISRIDERTTIEVESEPRRTVIPDVRITEFGGHGAGVAVAPPTLGESIVVDLGDEPITEGFVQVIDPRNGNRVITVIEFASPANKVSVLGREQYRRKQFELVFGGVSLVEIDLIRAGDWNLRAPLNRLKHGERGTYNVCVSRAWDTSVSELFPIKLQNRLPVIPIPLRSGDEQAILDLQVLMDQVYENGSYGQDVDYSRPPVPPLSELDATWANQFLATKL